MTEDTPKVTRRRFAGVSSAALAAAAMLTMADAQEETKVPPKEKLVITGPTTG